MVIDSHRTVDGLSGAAPRTALIDLLAAGVAAVDESRRALSGTHLLQSVSESHVSDYCNSVWAADLGGGPESDDSSWGSAGRDHCRDYRRVVSAISLSRCSGDSRGSCPGPLARRPTGRRSAVRDVLPP